MYSFYISASPRQKLVPVILGMSVTAIGQYDEKSVNVHSFGIILLKVMLIKCYINKNILNVTSYITKFLKVLKIKL